MTLNPEETLDSSIRDKGKDLHEWLNSLDSERKNAIIGYRTVRGEVPTEIERGDDIAWMEFKSTLDGLTEFGVGLVDEDSFFEFITDIDADIRDLFTDHEAWAALTLFEVSTYEQFDEVYFEAHIYQQGEKVNSTGIDLVGKSDTWELFTCKFNVTNQHEETGRRLQELQDVTESIEENNLIALGTLSIQIEERIRSTIDYELEKLVTEQDILNLGS